MNGCQHIFEPFSKPLSAVHRIDGVLSCEYRQERTKIMAGAVRCGERDRVETTASCQDASER